MKRSSRLFMSIVASLILILSLSSCSGMAELMGLKSGTDAPQVQIQYSVDGTSSWSSTYTSTCKYMRTSVDGGSTWSEAILFVGASGSTGAAGATGSEGPSVYLVTGTSSERIYSGGVYYSGLLTAINAYTTSTFAIVNKTGHVLTLTGSPYVSTSSSWFQSFAGTFSSSTNLVQDADYSALGSSINPDATTGNSFSTKFIFYNGPNGIHHKKYAIKMKDETTSEEFTLAFEVYGVCGS